MSRLPRFNLPFGNRAKQLAVHHPNDSGSTESLTSLTSPATKLHFTEDTESYMVAPPLPPMPSSSTSASTLEKSGTAARMWTWKKSPGSTSTLVSDEHIFKQMMDEPVRIDSTFRLTALRKKMIEENIDYFVIPAEDGHLSEYVADSDKRLRWISGFTGSAGTAIVSKRSAYLFVDSRYWIQAERELDANWTIHRVGTSEIKDWLDWAITCPRGSKIGIDSRFISHEKATRLYKGLYDRGSKLAHPRQNLIDLIWEDRPKRPHDPVYVQPLEFTGKDAKTKLEDIRRWIQQNRTFPQQTGTTAMPRPPSIFHVLSSSPTETDLTEPDKTSYIFISDLASIAYTLNLRGSDIPFNPVFTAYLLVGLDGQTILFIETNKLPAEVREYLRELGVSFKEYSEVWSFLRQKQWGEGKVIINPNIPYAVSLIIGSARYVVLPACVDEFKAIKNEVEIGGMRAACIRDSVAMVRWFAWLDQKFSQGYEMTEWEASEKLNTFRRDEMRAEDELPMYMGLAYENIVATGANAALVHYHPTRPDSKVISKTEPFLVGSGGQYRDGTCTTTRTVHFGSPTVEQSEAFTRVLQGHMAIDTAIFPAGTSGFQLDVLARKALWSDGLDYLHGTGHGIGSFLNVHEGPHSFHSTTPLQPGHVITNGPGYYKDGEFGIRISSVLLVVGVETKSQTGEEFLGFERLTQVPIQMKMVRASMLTKEERQWIEDHNSRVRKVLEPLLAEDKRALKWLRREY